MNNYRNYGNCGNRRYTGNMDDNTCAGNASARMMQNKAMMKAENDCGCMDKEEKPDCGCTKPGMTKPGYDCMMKDEKPECGCMMKEEKPAYECGWMDKCEKPAYDYGCYKNDMRGKALAMAYVPWQNWEKLYEVCEGFSTGTIFKELDLEFYGRRCN